eukprot:1192142-Prorocentrum_minimum.AAC.1
MPSSGYRCTLNLENLSTIGNYIYKLLINRRTDETRDIMQPQLAARESDLQEILNDKYHPDARGACLLASIRSWTECVSTRFSTKVLDSEGLKAFLLASKHLRSWALNVVSVLSKRRNSEGGLRLLASKAFLLASKVLDSDEEVRSINESLLSAELAALETLIELRVI